MMPSQQFSKLILFSPAKCFFPRELLCIVYLIEKLLSLAPDKKHLLHVAVFSQNQALFGSRKTDKRHSFKRSLFYVSSTQIHTQDLKNVCIQDG